MGEFSSVPVLPHAPWWPWCGFFFSLVFLKLRVMRSGQCGNSGSVGKVELWRMGLWEEMRTRLGNLGCDQRAREIA